MDLEAAKQQSREGFAASVATYKLMLAGLDDADRAWADRSAAAIRTTLQANGVPVNADTAKAFHMGVILPGVQICQHHPGMLRDEVPCLQTHVRMAELAAVQFLLNQQGGS